VIFSPLLENIMHSFRFAFTAQRRLATLSLFAMSLTVASATNAQQAAHHDHRAAIVAVPATAAPPTPAISKPAPAPQQPSIFDRYQRFNTDTPLLDWRSANQTVQQIGGWRAYAREAAAAAKQAQPATPIPPTTPGAAK
jgi:hypothetical protein